MTERKPPGVSWESWFEEQIRRAQAEGAFENLPGAGKPLPDLEEAYDPDWWVKKLIRREKVSLLPPALDLLRKVESEFEKIWKSRDEAEVRARVQALNAEIAKVNARTAEGPPTRLGPLDVDGVVEDWRRRTRSREARLESLILIISAIVTLSGCATSVSFHSADGTTTVDGTLFKPDGAGPFPAVVLLHGCGGIRPHFVQWAGTIRDMGYVALLVDSFRPRGISSICANSPTMAAMTRDRAADAYGALRHLKGLPFVDGDRVALMGWSHGGWTTLEAIASPHYRSSPDQFRAAIAFYPWCRDALTEPFRVPVLVLIGGSDDWTPAKKCEDMQARLTLVSPDAPPLRVQVYQGAHHDFDDVAARNCCGHTLQYKRDAAKDAEDQVRRFLAEHTSCPRCR